MHPYDEIVCAVYNRPPTMFEALLKMTTGDENQQAQFESIVNSVYTELPTDLHKTIFSLLLQGFKPGTEFCNTLLNLGYGKVTDPSKPMWEDYLNDQVKKVIEPTVTKYFSFGKQADPNAPTTVYPNVEPLVTQDESNVGRKKRIMWQYPVNRYPDLSDLRVHKQVYDFTPDRAVGQGTESNPYEDYCEDY